MNAPQHLHWHADRLWERLEPLLPGIGVEVVARTDSTNTRLLERARASSGDRRTPITRPGTFDFLDSQSMPPTRHGRRSADAQPCLLVAEQQTRGRGRLGRDWLATAGASLTFSLSLPLSPVDWSGFSLAVGCALADALDPLDASAPGATPRIGLKWPNDLWVLDDTPARGRKLGGILVETVAVGTRRMWVVGVGLNVLPQPAEGLTNGYACLQELDPEVTAPDALARVAVPLVEALLEFEAHGFAPFQPRFARRDLLLGHTVHTTAPQVPEGVADGVDAHGALRVRAGAVHHVVSGEVSVRLQPPG